jgi:hypothetical protein
MELARWDQENGIWSTDMNSRKSRSKVSLEVISTPLPYKYAGVKEVRAESKLANT